MPANVLGFNNNYGEWDICAAADLSNTGAVGAVRGDYVTCTKTGTGTYQFVIQNTQSLRMYEQLELSCNFANAIPGLTCQITSVTQTFNAAGISDDTIAVNVQLSGQYAAWSGNVSVASNTATLANAGIVTNVYVSAGTVTGVFNVKNAAPATSKDVQVSYSAAGVPTLTFLAGDAVSTAQVQQILQIPAAADTQVATTLQIWIALRTCVGPQKNQL